MCTYITKNFIETPPCAKKVVFITEFVLVHLSPHFYKVNQEAWKRPCAWRNFKNIVCVLLSGHPKNPFRTQKLSIFNFRYVKEVWASGLLGVKFHWIICCEEDQWVFFPLILCIIYFFFLLISSFCPIIKLVLILHNDESWVSLKTFVCILQTLTNSFGQSLKLIVGCGM